MPNNKVWVANGSLVLRFEYPPCSPGFPRKYELTYVTCLTMSHLSHMVTVSMVTDFLLVDPTLSTPGGSVDISVHKLPEGR